jgi:hypothetical protein
LLLALSTGKHLARLGYAYMSWGKLQQAQAALKESLEVEHSESVARYLAETEERLAMAGSAHGAAAVASPPRTADVPLGEPLHTCATSGPTASTVASSDAEQGLLSRTPLNSSQQNSSLHQPPDCSKFTSASSSYVSTAKASLTASRVGSFLGESHCSLCSCHLDLTPSVPVCCKQGSLMMAPALQQTS